MIFIVACLSIIYVTLIFLYVYGWIKLSSVPATPDFVPQTGVCVVIPARNEARRLAACIESVRAQNYPISLFDIIVVDDHSTDDTAAIAARYADVCLIRLADVLQGEDLPKAYKKKAIETAIAHTQRELIVTTDADCTMPTDWLRNIVHGYETKQAHIIAAPVQYVRARTFVERFQTLDFIGMMVATGASLHLRLATMCNGANLAYRRQTFYEVGGFAGIDHLASGDDMLLMAKIAQSYPNGIIFLKQLSATVSTYAQPTWADFAQQRLRWASKSASYQDRRITLFLAAVYLFNLAIVGCFVGEVLCGSGYYGLLGGYALGIKMLADAIFLSTGCVFFRRTDLLWWLIPAQIAHILYIVVIGTWGNTGTYTWKGRRMS